MNRFIHLPKPHQQVIASAGSAFIFIVSFVYSCAIVFSDWTLSRMPIPTTTHSSAQHDQQNWLKKIEALPAQHLFGASEENTSLIPISSLQIRITGISKITEEHSSESSSVLMSISGQPAKLYRIEDNVSPGVTIQDITNDAVIFRRQGKLEKVLLPRKPLEFKPRPSSRLSP